MKKFLFGPVPSRRLGISLGVDLVPAKTCSMDCVYCEAGKTSLLTLERKEYVPTREIIAELERFLSPLPQLDHITFSGAGEPTLHSGIGEIVSFIKDKFPRYKICLLTNGSFLGDRRLSDEISRIDLIVPSLDAADEESFRKINRPAEGLTCSKLIADLAAFRKSHSMLFWLEIFVVPGVNDGRESLESFRKAVETISPDKVQLNSLDRPPCEQWVPKADEETMLKFKDALSSAAPVEIIGKFERKAAPQGSAGGADIESRILGMLSRRPCTAEDISLSLGFETGTAARLLAELERNGRILAEKRERGVFYKSTACTG